MYFLLQITDFHFFGHSHFHAKKELKFYLKIILIKDELNENSNYTKPNNFDENDRDKYLEEHENWVTTQKEKINNLREKESNLQDKKYRINAELIENKENMHVIIDAGSWFSMVSSGEYSLIGCTVAPGFNYSDFELAPKNWEPG